MKNDKSILEEINFSYNRKWQTRRINVWRDLKAKQRRRRKIVECADEEFKKIFAN